MAQADGSIDLDALQAQIDLSIAQTNELVASWSRTPNSVASAEAKRKASETQREIEAYMHRPPRLGIGAPIPELHSLSADGAKLKLKNKLVGNSTKKRVDTAGDAVGKISDEDDEDKLQKGLCDSSVKKRRVDPFNMQKKGKNKGKEQVDDSLHSSVSQHMTNGDASSPVTGPNRHEKDMKGSYESSSAIRLTAGPTTSEGNQFSIETLSSYLSPPYETRKTRSVLQVADANDSQRTISDMSSLENSITKNEGPPIYTKEPIHICNNIVADLSASSKDQYDGDEEEWTGFGDLGFVTLIGDVNDDTLYTSYPSPSPSEHIKDNSDSLSPSHASPAGLANGSSYSRHRQLQPVDSSRACETSVNGTAQGQNSRTRRRRRK